MKRSVAGCGWGRSGRVGGRVDGGLGAGGRGEGAGDGRGRLVTGPGASCLVRSITYSRQWASHAESTMNQSWIG